MKIVKIHDNIYKLTDTQYKHLLNEQDKMSEVSVGYYGTTYIGEEELKEYIDLNEPLWKLIGKIDSDYNL